ncbi:hypothetical protein A2164_03475 [Candidatus Curtissbacteria bacterium RBG_13_35_7]|uniref:PsbP C-terminal domain-containing protein n=1 Tax=Candidatus Curtissbacteria bacterium RBG_13_35_7 TaxID=1797705 RepID=A0A1F5G413_9BACT|nr:MAG: hypothetical protein A2164_03475 [Candidatus Curtissbacteria bacterium RBG_13_35_7]
MPDYIEPNQIFNQPQGQPAQVPLAGTSPEQTPQQPQSQVPNIPFKPPVTPTNGQENGASKFSLKMLLVIALAFLLLVVIIAAVYFFVQNSKNNQASDQLLNQQNQLDAALNQNQSQIAPSPTPTPFPEHFYSNSAAGISFEAPNGWKKVESPSLLILYQNPIAETDASGNLFYPNLNLNVDNNPGTEILEEYVEKSNNSKIAYLENYSLIGSAKEQLGGQPAYIDDYTVTLDTIAVRQRQVISLYNGKAYIFTFSSLPESWQSNLPIYDTVRSTFIFSATVSGVRTGI